MFSLQAFLPHFSPWSALVIFPRQFFACALPSERLEPATRCCERFPPLQLLGPEAGSLRDSCPSGCEGDYGSVRGGSVRSRCRTA